MLRQIYPVLLGIAALLVSAGLLVAAVPAARTETAPPAADVDCPYAELVIVFESVE